MYSLQILTFNFVKGHKNFLVAERSLQSHTKTYTYYKVNSLSSPRVESSHV